MQVWRSSLGLRSDGEYKPPGKERRQCPLAVTGDVSRCHFICSPTSVSTGAQLSFPVHVSALAKTIEVKQTRCGGGRLPLPEGIKPEAPHLASASQGLGKAASGKDPRDFTAGAGARGVDTRRAALTPGGDPGPGPRQGPALRGGSQGRVTGAENKAPPLGKAG